MRIALLFLHTLAVRGVTMELAFGEEWRWSVVCQFDPGRSEMQVSSEKCIAFCSQTGKRERHRARLVLLQNRLARTSCSKFSSMFRTYSSACQSR